jgi:flagellar protein FlaG
MSNPVVNPAQPVEPTGPQANAWPPAADVTAPAPSRAPSSFSPDLRLVIEEDKSAGSYVYKTVDVLTGKVVQQIPREELLRLRDTATYEPGAVVNARG